MTPPEVRTNVLKVWVRSTEKTLIKQAAQKLGMPVSTYIRMLALSAAEEAVAND